MSDIWELQAKLDEAKELVIEKVLAYGDAFDMDDKEEIWSTWCDIDEALEKYRDALNDYVACEI